MEMPPPDLTQLSLDEVERALVRLTAARERRAKRNALASFEPYPKQFDFFKAGIEHRERLLMAGNRVGKTFCGAMEAAVHLTGRYPDWWPGRRFGRPIEMWAGSNTSETTRDTVQRNLIGPPPIRDEWGTAAIPADAIVDVSPRQGVADAIDTVVIRHVTGGNSLLGFKSYDQKRHKWQGTQKDVVWLDEEPETDIYTEALTRINAVPDGIIYLTFTPILGMSEVVRMFLSGGGA